VLVCACVEHEVCVCVGGESCHEMAWGGMRGGPCPSIYSHGGGIRGSDERISGRILKLFLRKKILGDISVEYLGSISERV
jgi:hypothetical protein